ncbi:MAG: hypothetical protein KDH98_13015 [Calditrichaeota bacterium]|nr:hypothetical protein [Calditrichota bacterium]
MKKWFLLMSLVAGYLLTACSVTMPGGILDATQPADNGQYQILGEASGQSKSTFVFGIQSSKPDFHAAISQAVASLNGDALINVRWYSTTNNWVILPVTTITVTVEGDVIKYQNGGAGQ